SIHGFPINIENSGSALTAANQNELQSILNSLYAGAPSIPDAITGQLHSGVLSLPGTSSVRLTVQYQDSYLVNDTFGIFTAAIATDALGNPLLNSSGGVMLNSATIQQTAIFSGKGATTEPFSKLTNPPVADLSVGPGGATISSPSDCATMV